MKYFLISFLITALPGFIAATLNWHEFKAGLKCIMRQFKGM